MLPTRALSLLVAVALPIGCAAGKTHAHPARVKPVFLTPTAPTDASLYGFQGKLFGIYVNDSTWIGIGAVPHSNPSADPGATEMTALGATRKDNRWIVDLRQVLANCIDNLSPPFDPTNPGYVMVDRDLVAGQQVLLSDCQIGGGPEQGASAVVGAFPAPEVLLDFNCDATYLIPGFRRLTLRRGERVSYSPGGVKNVRSYTLAFDGDGLTLTDITNSTESQYFKDCRSPLVPDF